MIVGIDGEGIGRYPHKYVLLAVSDATGDFQKSIQNLDGLSSNTCLSFLSDLSYEYPEITAFSFSFGYDITKILQDLPDSIIYRILRPEERKDSKGDVTEQIFGPFCINYLGSKLTVRRGFRNGVKSKETGLVIWDVFKFFQGTFVKALEDWEIGSHDISFIQGMKEARGEFDSKDFHKIKSYCFQECRYLAQLVHKLSKAHEKAGLKLKNYYGAGSTASALLDTMNIKELVQEEIPYSREVTDFLVEDSPLTMRSAVLRAFFGGRFENSIIGPVLDDVYSYDISSAYPYQIVQLPCLKHGLWKLTYNREDLNEVRQALVVWYSDYSHMNNLPLWGSLPFRYAGGSIIFPVTGGCGCTYLKEFEQAEAFGIKFKCAWILDQDCDCQPFKDIPFYYNERCRIGKDGPGIVLKLGINAGYGKLAQSVGNPQYNSWLWAGMVTSGCRAQILEAIKYHKNEENLLAIATDGIYSLEKLILPKPIDTGTNDYGKPLGGWEEKIVKGGMFFARPGVNFSIKTPEDAKLARGRGYGRRIIVNHYQAIIDSFERGDNVHIFPDVVRFNGAKNTITRRNGEQPFRLYDYTRSPKYGEWGEEPMKLDFCPEPKRSGRVGNRLLPWQVKEGISAEYDKGKQDETYGLIGKEQPM